MTREEHYKIMKALVDAAKGKSPTTTEIFRYSAEEAVNRAI